MGRSSVFLVGVLLLYCSVMNAFAEEVCNCPQGDGCCNGTCYDPSAYHCAGNAICPIGLLRCGADCYDPAYYTCCSDQLCQLHDSSCCGNPPSPSNPPVSSQDLCAPNYLACGAACYLPSVYYCCNGAALCLLGDSNCCGSTPTSEPSPPPTTPTIPTISAVTTPGTLIFSDDFNGIDSSKWQYDINLGGGNGEFEFYTNNPRNSYVRDGVLVIKPSLTADSIGYDQVMSGYTLDLTRIGCSPAHNPCQITSGGGRIINPIQSARMTTVRSFSCTYCHVQIRAKLPRGDWLWPALWMITSNWPYGAWPRSGEIDIMESRGNSASYPGGVDKFASTLHWGTSEATNRWAMTHAEATAPGGSDFSQEFHTYGLYWTPDRIYTYLDDPNNIVMDIPITESFYQRGGFGDANPWAGRHKSAPFDQTFYLCLNLAVGGTVGYFPEGVGGKPWSNGDPNAAAAFWNNRNQWLPTWDLSGENSALHVDWIRVYQL